MAFNLLDTVRGYLTPELIQKTGDYLGESPSDINKAASAAVPAVLATFVDRAEKGDAQELLNEATAAADDKVLADPRQLASTGGIGYFLTGGLDRFKRLFGNRSSGIVNTISGFAGIKTASAQSLLGLLAPLGLGALGKYAKESHMSAQGLSSMLLGQKTAIIGALPAGLSMGSLLGDGFKTETRIPQAVHRPASRSNWLTWALLALAAAALIWFIARRNRNLETASMQTTQTNTARESKPAELAKGSPMSITLVNGKSIQVLKGGVEEQLVSCLRNAACIPGTDRWFDFDQINFETGSARLTPSSMQQVNNLAAILNAYPGAHVKVGGYTDKKGNESSNLRLSQQRAEAVLQALKNAGVNQVQLTGAEGYGSSFAKVPAGASDEERRTDRRISLQLNQK